MGGEGGLWLGLLGYVRVGSGLGLVARSEGTRLERWYTVGWGRQSVRGMDSLDEMIDGLSLFLAFLSWPLLVSASSRVSVGHSGFSL